MGTLGLRMRVLSPMDADTCGDETSMHLEGPQSLVNIAHIEKVK